MSRQQGVIFQWNERRFGFIRSERGQSVFFRADGICRDWKQSRAWAFYNGPGLPVTFDILFGNGKGERAENIEPLFPLEEPGDLDSLREVSAVLHTFPGNYGFLTRPCGDGLFFHVENVGEAFRDRWSLLRPGTPVFHGVGLVSDGKSRAVNVELYSAAELSCEPEPEPIIEQPFNACIKSLPAVTHESELLSSALRSKTLLEIVEEKRNAKIRVEAFD